MGIIVLYGKSIRFDGFKLCDCLSLNFENLDNVSASRSACCVAICGVNIISAVSSIFHCGLFHLVVGF